MVAAGVGTNHDPTPRGSIDVYVIIPNAWRIDDMQRWRSGHHLIAHPLRAGDQASRRRNHAQQRGVIHLAMELMLDQLKPSFLQELASKRIVSMELWRRD
jgi:hypothetical protein